MKSFSGRQISVVLLLVVLVLFCFFSACEQLTDAALPAGGWDEAGVSSTSDRESVSEKVGPPSSAGANAAFQNPPPVWSDYEYNKGQQVEVGNDYLSPILNYQDNKAHAAHLLKILRDEVVPQSVQALLRTFPKTFGYLQGREIGMGVALNTNDDVAVASFYSDIPHSTVSEPVSSVYGLTVGYFRFSWEEENAVLSSHSRKDLESAVAHEMMHALMCESLTCGYTGYDSNLNKDSSQMFPSWFREGTAEAVCGAARSVWLTVNRKYKLERMEQQYIEEFLREHPLTKGDFVSDYQTGWLAVMYLGWMANGRTSMEPAAIAAGLDTLLSQVHSGKSLNDAIRDNSQGNFSSLSDFESKFISTNKAVVDFGVELINKIGSGRGSVLVSSYANDDNLLPDTPADSPLFWLYVRRDTYTNKYNDSITAQQMFKGGAVTKQGIPGPGASAL